MKNIDENNFYLCAEISAFYHIINEPHLSKIWLEKASKIKGFNDEYDSLYKLLKGNHGDLNEKDRKAAFEVIGDLTRDTGLEWKGVNYDYLNDKLLNPKK